MNTYVNICEYLLGIHSRRRIARSKICEFNNFTDSAKLPSKTASTMYHFWSVWECLFSHIITHSWYYQTLKWIKYLILICICPNSVKFEDVFSVFWPPIIPQGLPVQITCPVSLDFFSYWCGDVETLLYSECNFQSVTCSSALFMVPFVTKESKSFMWSSVSNRFLWLWVWALCRFSLP